MLLFAVNVNALIRGISNVIFSSSFSLSSFVYFLKRTEQKSIRMSKIKTNPLVNARSEFVSLVTMTGYIETKTIQINSMTKFRKEKRKK